MPRRSREPARGPAVRPRYGRITSALTSVLVTAVALLGASGVLSAGSASGPPPTAGAETGAAADAMALSQYTGAGHDPGMTTPGERAAAERAAARGGAPRALSPTTSGRTAIGPPGTVASDDLPATSGEGRRVVFSIGAQRVWLVDDRERVRRTYLVSGSLTDNLGPGTYEVYSKSRHATGIDDSGTMQYMVRFTQGERAAIGFHDIPVKDGRPLQTRAELGTPLSSGCIRQARPDARALWEFAPEGTTVVVLA